MFQSPPSSNPSEILRLLARADCTTDRCPLVDSPQIAASVRVRRQSTAVQSEHHWLGGWEAPAQGLRILIGDGTGRHNIVFENHPVSFCWAHVHVSLEKGRIAQQKKLGTHSNMFLLAAYPLVLKHGNENPHLID